MAARKGRQSEKSSSPNTYPVRPLPTSQKLDCVTNPSNPGFNTSLTLQAHKKSIPAQPALGSLLSKFPITLPAPHLSSPREPNDGDDDDDDDDPEDPADDGRPHFIRDATMHL